MTPIYARTGDFKFPIPQSLVTGNLSVLDPVRGRLLALFKTAIEAELSTVWNAAAGGTSLNGRAVVHSTFELEPNHQHLQQAQSGLPMLALHRFGEATDEEHTLELDKVTQRWALHYILGALEIADARRLCDILVVVPQLVRAVIRKNGHPAFENGALQFFPETGGLQSIRLVSSESGQAPYGSGGGTLYYATIIRLEIVEICSDTPGAEGDFLGASYDVGIGGGEGVQGGLLLGDTDPEYQDP